eukprot:2909457-Amphidinium_carterae.1
MPSTAQKQTIANSQHSPVLLSADTLVKGMSGGRCGGDLEAKLSSTAFWLGSGSILTLAPEIRNEIAWRAHVDFMLGDRVFGFEREYSGMLFRPEWTTILRYEHEIRKLAMYK